MTYIFNFIKKAKKMSIIILGSGRGGGRAPPDDDAEEDEDDDEEEADGEEEAEDEEEDMFRAGGDAGVERLRRLAGQHGGLGGQERLARELAGRAGERGHPGGRNGGRQGRSRGRAGGRQPGRGPRREPDEIDDRYREARARRLELQNKLMEPDTNLQRLAAKKAEADARKAESVRNAEETHLRREREKRQRDDEKTPEEKARKRMRNAANTPESMSQLVREAFHEYSQKKPELLNLVLQDINFLSFTHYYDGRMQDGTLLHMAAMSEHATKDLIKRISAELRRLDLVQAKDKNGFTAYSVVYEYHKYSNDKIWGDILTWIREEIPDLEPGGCCIMGAPQFGEGGAENLPNDVKTTENDLLNLSNLTTFATDLRFIENLHSKQRTPNTDEFSETHVFSIGGQRKKLWIRVLNTPQPVFSIRVTNRGGDQLAHEEYTDANIFSGVIADIAEGFLYNAIRNEQPKTSVGAAPLFGTSFSQAATPILYGLLGLTVTPVMAAAGLPPLTAAVTALTLKTIFSVAKDSAVVGKMGQNVFDYIVTTGAVQSITPGPLAAEMAADVALRQLTDQYETQKQGLKLKLIQRITELLNWFVSSPAPIGVKVIAAAGLAVFGYYIKAIWDGKKNPLSIARDFISLFRRTGNFTRKIVDKDLFLIDMLYNVQHPDSKLLPTERAADALFNNQRLDKNTDIESVLKYMHGSLHVSS